MLQKIIFRVIDYIIMNAGARQMYKMIFSVVVYMVWKKRDARHFQNCFVFIKITNLQRNINHNIRNVPNLI